MMGQVSTVCPQIRFVSTTLSPGIVKGRTVGLAKWAAPKGCFRFLPAPDGYAGRTQTAKQVLRLRASTRAGPSLLLLTLLPLQDALFCLPC